MDQEKAIILKKQIALFGLLPADMLLCFYRGISILPRLSLCLEKLLFNFIYSNVLHKLSRRQHGFVEKRSTFTQLLEYVENIYKCIDANEIFGSVYFDIQKAFDSVSHKQLLNKLSSFGFDKNFIMLISSYLSNRLQRVRINNIRSYKGYVSSGVPQGSILGPLLFLIYINDLPDVVKYSSPSLFADDLKLLYRDNCHDNFQSDLDSVETWATQNGLDFHPEKTKLISNNSFIFNLYLNRSEIYSVDHIKDLGIYISPTLSWNHHVSAKLGKTTKCFHYLKRNVPFNSPVKTKLQMYISYVSSILLYNSCIWYPHLSKLRDLENFQKKAVKWIIGSTDSLVMLNILPICYQIIFTDCLLFFKLLHNCYDFEINDYVTVSESRPGNRSSQRMVFSVPLTRKFCSLGSFFQRTIHSVNSVLAKIDINSTTTVSQTKTLLFNFLKQQFQSTFNLDNPCTF